MRGLVLLGLGLVACGGESAVGDSAAEVSRGLCDEVDGPVTWDNFGAGFLVQSCQGCHNGQLTGDARQGAPVEVRFDTEEDALAWSDRIVAVATGELATMPPQGGLTEEDRLLLEVWLTCWTP